MIDMPERIWACVWRWYGGHKVDHFWGVVKFDDNGDGRVLHEEEQVEYIRADIYHKELAALAIESKDRELALARLEGEVHALRKLCSDRSCNHAWDREWRDDRTGRVFRNCVICGVKVEMP